MRSSVNIVFFTTGKGSGHAVHAVSIYYALQRAGIAANFSMISDMEYNHIVADLFANQVIQMQPNLFMKRDTETELYYAIEQTRPDIFIADGTWLPLLPILDDFRFKKIMLFRQYDDWWFSAPTKKYGLLEFSEDQYTRVFSIEPGFCRAGWEILNPVVILNHDEILPREEARNALGANDDRKLCVVAHNGFEGEFDEISRKANNFHETYRVIQTTNRQGRGLFPLVRYYNGIDLIIGAAGYNMFYETRYFDIPAHLFPLQRRNEDMEWRIETNSNYTFTKNGADELVEIIQGL